MKNLLAKKNVLLCLSILASLVVFLSLVFSLDYVSTIYGSTGDNGFDAMSQSNWDVVVGSGLAIFSQVLSIVILIAAILLIAGSIIAYLKGVDMLKVAVVVSAVAIVLAILYLIDGILLANKVKEMIGSANTAAFWPLILQVLICMGTIVSVKLMKD